MGKIKQSTAEVESLLESVAYVATVAERITLLKSKGKNSAALLGGDNVASGKNSLASGVGLEAKSEAEIALGRYNKSAGEYKLEAGLYSHNAQSSSKPLGRKYLPTIEKLSDSNYIIYNLFGSNDEYDATGNIGPNMSTRYRCFANLSEDGTQLIVTSGLTQIAGTISNVAFNIDFQDNDILVSYPGRLRLGMVQIEGYSLRKRMNIQTTSLYTLGMGTSENDRKNAQEVTNDGKQYIFGLGGYEGVLSAVAKDLVTVINELEARIKALEDMPPQPSVDTNILGIARLGYLKLG